MQFKTKSSSKQLILNGYWFEFVTHWGRGLKFYIRKYEVKNLLKIHLARNAETCVEESSDRVDTNLLKSWLFGVGWDHNGGGKI